MSVVGTFAHPQPTRASAPVSLEKPIQMYHQDQNEEPYEDPTSQMTADETAAYRSAEIGHLARQLTRQSTRVGDNVFDYEEGSDLDPFSSNFNARKYTKTIGHLSKGQGFERLSGLSYKNMSVHGFGSDSDYQKTVGNLGLSIASSIRDKISGRKKRVQILNGVDGVLEAGEMLVVLGPPGSGCTTLLKSIAGEMNGIYLDEKTELNYRGISPEQMRGQFRGEAIYTAEVDVHFPNLTVGQTLAFAAEARAPKTLPEGITTRQFSEHSRDVMMSIFGIGHTINTIVGNDFIRGVSGGERKRVTICEAALSGAPLQCWDNSTRGLDSANAIEFCKNLKMGSEFMGFTSVVAIYQAPQSAYDLFDKVCVLYEGEQIYFGPIGEAKEFFVNMGFHCPDQQTTPDFLTSLTSASERQAREGFEHKVPNTAAEFAAVWKKSPEYQRLMDQIARYQEAHPFNSEKYEQFLSSRRAQQSPHARAKSEYTLSYGDQVKLCLRRGFWRLKADPSLTLTQLFGNFAMALIISSVFFNLQNTTASFYQRGSLLFFAILINAFGAALEILTLYAQRPIVEKHTQYAFYHSSAEAFASMLTDMPYKILNALITNLTIYFMTNLRRDPGHFFFFLFVSFFTTLCMSMIFRTIAASSRTFILAMTPASLFMVGLIIYTGFAIPVTQMRGWARWINYINPIAYAFEALMVNEFHNQDFACSQFVPAGPEYPAGASANTVCATVGAVPGSSTVNGDTYLNVSYEYYNAHKWRNVGIIFAFLIAFMLAYLFATEYISAEKSKGEVLVFQRGRFRADKKNASKHSDVESQNSNSTRAERGSEQAGHEKEINIQRQTAVFSWKDVVYDIKIKKEERRILDHVDGWVKPGTLTALMGVSGAGKTTLLDVLATRVTMGVVTGEMLVDGEPRDVSFQRKTGYVQQQDVHLQTSTVREALEFSALLRQPKHISKEEKLAYVDEVLKLLEMETYADAVVGVPGEGLNVEQRKRLTIGVELVAKPALLLFLDEPTSGLDSQTSWNILQLLRKLTAHGQAILCTIHQPSAILFENFDRLLFLAKGGKTVYFGEVGQGSRILIDYFERQGAPKCPKGENPAEWMLSAIGAAPGSHTDVNWHQAWLDSPERVAVREELAKIQRERSQIAQEERAKKGDDSKMDKAAYAEFAAGPMTQFWVVNKRNFQQYWRTPSYIWSKFILTILAGLFIGFSFFGADRSLAGLQSQLFSVFMMFLLFSQLVQQIMPNFVTQRSLYEIRERPAKTYSWKVFILSNIVVEIPWSILVATCFFFCWYYPIGYYRNATFTDAVHIRGFLMWLYTQEFFLFTSTFSIAIVAAMDSAETAGNIANLMFSLCLIFCGVLASASTLPGFWIFMYRVSPFTYFVEGMLGTAVAQAPIECSSTEFQVFNPPDGETCIAYMQTYIQGAGGYLLDDNATSNCQFCQVRETDTFLGSFQIKFANRWRDFGILWVYIIVNVFAAIFFYWLARVPKKSGKEEGKKAKKNETNERSEKSEPEKAIAQPKRSSSG